MNNRKSIRFDDRTVLLLSEIAETCGVSISSVVKYIIQKELNSMYDENGYMVSTLHNINHISTTGENKKGNA
jgi:hypothetical protein